MEFKIKNLIYKIIFINYVMYKKQWDNPEVREVIIKNLHTNVWKGIKEWAKSNRPEEYKIAEDKAKEYKISEEDKISNDKISNDKKDIKSLDILSIDINIIIIIQKNIRGYLCRRPFISVVMVSNFINLIDLKKLSNYIKTEFNGIRGDIAKEEEANLKIDSDISEYIIAKCIDNGKRVGKGNGPIDVENDNIGIDVACLCLNGNTTNEKSLGQKFTGEGGNLLDLHFTNKKDNIALDLYINEIKNKLCRITKEIYYFILISTKKDIYLSILSVNPKSLIFIKSCGFSPQNKNIITSGFIDNKYGNVKLYKSKKRLELRLHKPILEKSYHLFTLN